MATHTHNLGGATALAEVRLRINIPLLKEQKQALLHAIDTCDSVTDKPLLDGILNLLDYIHDELDPPTT